jgi:hypothetical protein
MRPLSFLVVLVAVLIASGWQYRAELGLFGEGRQPVGVHGAMGAGERPVGSAAAAEVWLRTSVTGVDHARCAASSARVPRPPDVSSALTASGTGFSPYDCRVALLGQPAREWCVIGLRMTDPAYSDEILWRAGPAPCRTLAAADAARFAEMAPATIGAGTAPGSPGP